MAASPLPFESDPEMVAAFDAAALWLLQVRMCAMATGKTAPEGIGSLLPRLFTGYTPKAQRTAANALAFRTCLRTPRPRVTAADKALAEAKRWGLAS